MNVPDKDTVHRTALLGARDGSHPTLEAALDAHAATGIAVVAGTQPGRQAAYQAALCTATATAARAFGSTRVVADGDGVLTAGPYRGRTVADALAAEGATLAADLQDIPAHWPVVLLGAPDAALQQGLSPHRVVLQVAWKGWTASVRPVTGPAAATDSVNENTESVENGEDVLAALCAAALGVHEAFGAVQARPGSDAGYRPISLDLWSPTGEGTTGPSLTHAPASWWLVGLGHLGQANAWVLSWLPYPDPTRVRVVLQDVDTAVEANHSTGMLTPRRPAQVRKTRLVAARLDALGFDTHIIEQRLHHTTRVPPKDTHVALLGVDNLATRRMISAAGWNLAIDAGLGAGPADFNAIQLRRFPAARPSDQVTAWADPPADAPELPRNSAFDDLSRRDACGAVQLAGTAVGAAFVGVIAACLTLAEATRPLLGGTGLDVLSLHLGSADLEAAPASRPSFPIAIQLTTR
ncbi:hypothetical protein ACIPSJ_26835 [Streptomyces sp. NPDC090088]|uniref:hypothetical protein n=1 Tax=Streptomyces sp. NPDC090088 TaxID=3365944 RepID=UPI003807D225